MNNLNTEEKIKEFWEFVGTHGRLPNSKVNEESALYQWCCSVVAGQIDASDSLSAVLAEIKRLRRSRKDEMTEERVREFWAFVEKNDRLPKKSVKEERVLYEWINKVKANVRHLAERHPDVNEKIDFIRERDCTENVRSHKVQEFWEFVEKYGRLPKKRRMGEARLYGLCVDVSQNLLQMRDTYPQVWEKMRELGWQSKKEKINQKEQEFCDFVEMHGRIPLRSEAGYRRMKGLYYGLKKNIGNTRSNYPKAWALVKDKVNSISPVRRHLIEDFYKFVEEHGHIPSRKEERCLYEWCRKMVLNKGGIREKYPEAWEKMRELGIPDRRKVMKGEERVKEFWEFVNTHGRIPEWNAKDEKNLYQWCAHVASSKTYPDVEAKLKEMGWGRKTLNESMNALVEFVEKNGRLPKYSIKEERGMYVKYKVLKQNKKGERERFMGVWTKISHMEHEENQGETLQNKLSAFVRKFGRLPENRDTDYHNLYQWCLSLLRNPELRKKNPKAADILSKFGRI